MGLAGTMAFTGCGQKNPAQALQAQSQPDKQKVSCHGLTLGQKETRSRLG
jgi:hypothetical protein